MIIYFNILFQLTYTRQVTSIDGMNHVRRPLTITEISHCLGGGSAGAIHRALRAGAAEGALGVEVNPFRQNTQSARFDPQTGLARAAVYLALIHQVFIPSAIAADALCRAETAEAGMADAIEGLRRREPWSLSLAWRRDDALPLAEYAPALADPAPLAGPAPIGETILFLPIVLGPLFDRGLL